MGEEILTFECSRVYSLCYLKSDGPLEESTTPERRGAPERNSSCQDEQGTFMIINYYTENLLPAIIVIYQ